MKVKYSPDIQIPKAALPLQFFKTVPNLAKETHRIGKNRVIGTMDYTYKCQGYISLQISFTYRKGGRFKCQITK